MQSSTIGSSSHDNVSDMKSTNASSNPELLNILAWNIYGLTTLKLSLHKELFHENHVILLTETWANEHSQFYLEGYNFHNFYRRNK